MTTGSYLEHYLTLLAWVINNGIWNTLVFTGLFALALGAMIICEWMDARAQGADEGNKGVLSVLRVENRIYVAYLVILFACVPLLPLDITHLQFDTTRSKECGVNVAAPEQTGWGKAFDQIGGQSGKVPVWWALVHVISKGVTASATAAIPCYPDIRGAAMEIDETRIPDQALLRELNDFKDQCYAEAQKKLVHVYQPSLTPAEDHDTGWIGSRYFLEKPGYYDSIQSETPLKNWPYKEARDSGYGKTETGAGYPFCKEWWSDKGIGLRERLISTVKPDAWLRFKNIFGFTSDQDMHAQVLRQLVSPAHLAKTNSMDSLYANTADFGRASGNFIVNSIRSRIDGTKNALANIGLLLKGVSFFPSMQALRMALPMVQAFLIMGIIICLPLIIVMSTYNLKVVMMTSFGLFSLHMLTFWWELARWLDSSLQKGLYAHMPLHLFASMGEVLDKTLAAQVIEFVMAGMFLILPGLFFAAMSWAGFALGRGMDGMLGKATGSAQQAAAAGGGAAVNAGKMIATRGKGK